MTAQTPEKLLYNNRLCIIDDEPLSDIVHNSLFCIESSYEISTGCHRRYEGYWEILNKRLWLVGLFSSGSSAKPLRLFRGGESLELPMHAWWFDSRLCLPEGRELTWAMQGTGGEHEFTRWLYFEKGTLVRQRRIDNRHRFRRWFKRVSTEDPEYAQWLTYGRNEKGDLLAWAIQTAGYEALGIDVPDGIDSSESVTSAALSDIREEHGEWSLLQKLQRPAVDLAT